MTSYYSDATRARLDKMRRPGTSTSKTRSYRSSKGSGSSRSYRKDESGRVYQVDKSQQAVDKRRIESWKKRSEIKQRWAHERAFKDAGMLTPDQASRKTAEHFRGIYELGTSAKPGRVGVNLRPDLSEGMQKYTRPSKPITPGDVRPSVEKIVKFVPGLGKVYDAGRYTAEKVNLQRVADAGRRFGQKHPEFTEKMFGVRDEMLMGANIGVGRTDPKIMEGKYSKDKIDMSDYLSGHVLKFFEGQSKDYTKQLREAEFSGFMHRDMPTGASRHIFEPLRQFGTGILKSPATLMETAGMAAVGGEFFYREPKAAAALVPVGIGLMGSGMYTSAVEHPYEFAGEMLGTAVVSHGVAKITPSPKSLGIKYTGFKKFDIMTEGKRQVITSVDKTGKSKSYTTFPPEKATYRGLYIDLPFQKAKSVVSVLTGSEKTTIGRITRPSEIGQITIPQKLLGYESKKGYTGIKLPDKIAGHKVPTSIGKGYKVPTELYKGYDLPKKVAGSNIGKVRVPEKILGKKVPERLGRVEVPETIYGYKVPSTVGKITTPKKYFGKEIPDVIGKIEMPGRLLGKDIPSTIGKITMPSKLFGKDIGVVGKISYPKQLVGLIGKETFFKGFQTGRTFYKGVDIPKNLFGGVKTQRTLYKGVDIPKTLYKGIKTVETKYLPTGKTRQLKFKGEEISKALLGRVKEQRTIFSGINIPKNIGRVAIPDTLFAGVKVPKIGFGEVKVKLSLKDRDISTTGAPSKGFHGHKGKGRESTVPEWMTKKESDIMMPSYLKELTKSEAIKFEAGYDLVHSLKKHTPFSPEEMTWGFQKYIDPAFGPTLEKTLTTTPHKIFGSGTHPSQLGQKTRPGGKSWESADLDIYVKDPAALAKELQAGFETSGAKQMTTMKRPGDTKLWMEDPKSKFGKEHSADIHTFGERQAQMGWGLESGHSVKIGRYVEAPIYEQFQRKWIGATSKIKDKKISPADRRAKDVEPLGDLGFALIEEKHVIAEISPLGLKQYRQHRVKSLEKTWEEMTGMKYPEHTEVSKSRISKYRKDFFKAEKGERYKIKHDYDPFYGKKTGWKTITKWKTNKEVYGMFKGMKPKPPVIYPPAYPVEYPREHRKPYPPEYPADYVKDDTKYPPEYPKDYPKDDTKYPPDYPGDYTDYPPEYPPDYPGDYTDYPPEYPPDYPETSRIPERTKTPFTTKGKMDDKSKYKKGRRRKSGTRRYDIENPVPEFKQLFGELSGKKSKKKPKRKTGFSTPQFKAPNYGNILGTSKKSKKKSKTRRK